MAKGASKSASTGAEAAGDFAKFQGLHICHGSNKRLQLEIVGALYVAAPPYNASKYFVRACSFFCLVYELSIVPRISYSYYRRRTSTAEKYLHTNRTFYYC